jgi:predicted kinase
MEALIFCGIQATGKSTFYKERFFNSHVRLSMDLLNTRHKEKRFLDMCIELQQRFVVDNTNPTIEDRQRYILPAREAKYKIIGYFFQSKIQDALQRNEQRVGKDRIDEKGITGTRNRLVLPTLAEGFDELYFVQITPENTFSVTAW